MTKTLDCSLEVSEFELLSLCKVHFRINTLSEGMISPAMASIILLLFYKDGFRIK